MITIFDLCNSDKSLEIISGDGSLAIASITNLDHFVPRALLFIGAKRYLEIYKNSLDFDGSESLVVAETIWQNLSLEIQDELKVRTRAIMVSKDFSLSISILSKPFYELKYSQLNFQVDGRKMGSSQIHPSVKLSENVFIGENCTISADCTIMAGVSILPNVHIGQGTIIFPNVTIYPYVEIGKHCRIHAGTTIGSDGFGYNFSKEVHHKVWHFGGVLLGDDVEIGANVSIDQGTFSPTLIGEGTKIDNLVHVGHNVKIGPGVIICGQVGFAGSAKIGAFTVFGGKAAIGEGVELGKAVEVAGACVVTRDWPNGEKLGGHPARPLREWLRGMAFINRNSKK